MRNVVLKSIETTHFRANPNYKLILFDRLPPEQQGALKDLQEDPDFYGILYPRAETSLGIKSVCQETALLFFTLQEPGKLPSYVRARFGEQCNQAIAELVLDGMLEIEHNGTFVSGADAYELIYRDEPLSASQGEISQLSIEALKYAQALALDDVPRLSARLYFYNRVPLSPQWKRRFPTPDAVAEYLGIRGDGPNKLMLDQHWLQVSSPPANDGWLMWRPRYERRAPQRNEMTYKLYVSPACEFVRDAFQAFLEESSALRTSTFKVGKTVYGLLRPDKLVVYFESFEDLAKAADHLQHRLEGCPAHGVPFTAGITPDGLLSWGIDPPRAAQAPIWQVRESWRLWVTNRLATALVVAKASQSGAVEPWQFALERLCLAGVDVETWAPTGKIWHKYAGAKE